MHESHWSWLADEGRTLLEHDLNQAAGNQIGLDPWQKAMLAQQIELRARARRRFPNPHQWLWTERSLAQASDWSSAAYKASLFPPQCSVLDACCGAGVDAIALAALAQVQAVDRDPLMCWLTASNARWQGRALQVENASMSPVAAQRYAEQAAYLHIDPDRRSGERRLRDADQFSPPLDEVLGYMTYFRGGIVKIAPATQFPIDPVNRLDVPLTRVWLGNHRECRQQLLLFGELAEEAGQLRGAVLAEPPAAQPNPPAGRQQGAGEAQVQRYVAAARKDAACTQECSEYIFDLHPVLHASELHTAWAAEHGLQALGSDGGYYAGSLPLQTPWAQCFELLEEMAWDDRRVRKWLRGADAGVVEVKNRLIRLDAGACQRRYSGRGSREITLLVTQLRGRVRVLAARRCT